MDIVGQLKKIDIDDIRGWPFSTLETIDQAINEITRLREENNRMRDVMDAIISDPDSTLSLVAWRELAKELATTGGE